MDDQQIVLYLLICTLIMLVLALSFLWFLNHAQKKITRSRLKEQELKMEYQQSLLLNTVKTKENERSRIAAELHDEVSSQLGIINLNLYAAAKVIALSFEAEQNHIVMKYTDDGVGYDVDNVTTGLGISNINTRVALLMGEIEIKSSVGNGFQSVIKFPNHD